MAAAAKMKMAAKHINARQIAGRINGDMTSKRVAA